MRAVLAVAGLALSVAVGACGGERPSSSTASASASASAPVAVSIAPPVSASAAPSAPVAPPVEPPLAVASIDDLAAAPEVTSDGCYEQRPQAFLVRSTYWPVRQHKAEHAKSLRYRAETYGVIPKLTPRDANTHSPEHETQVVPFMGQNVQIHRLIAPPLRCVERAINRTCPNQYHPEILSGWRPKNTYHQGEVSNHVFGIAVDVDPHKNPCCHCIEPWSNHPRCADRKATAYQHTELPACWIEAFERFGFYWLGHDKLEDTMHFEFLGDPKHVVAPPAKKGKPAVVSK